MRVYTYNPKTIYMDELGRVEILSCENVEERNGRAFRLIGILAFVATVATAIVEVL